MIAREGRKEIALATLILGSAGGLAYWLYGPLAAPFAALWIWVLAFFRDPPRRRAYARGELCAPADGTVTEVTRLPAYEPLGRPAVRIGIFLSLFNVHINRMPCSGRIRSIEYRKGEFLDARHPESGQRNESNTLLIDPDAPLPGPVEVRQVAGLVARRIVCNVAAGQHHPIGARIGLIKFGSRTELVIPLEQGTEILVSVGDKVRGALSLLARQACLVDSPHDNAHAPGLADGGQTPSPATAAPAAGS